MSVREIRKWPQTTRMRNRPHSACGVLFIRGTNVRIYDQASMLRAHNDQDDASNVTQVVSPGNCDVGVTADSVSDIIFDKSDNLRPSPNREGQGADTVSKLAKTGDQLIAVLDLDLLFPTYAAH